MARLDLINLIKSTVSAGILCLSIGFASLAEGGNARRCPSNYVYVAGDIDFGTRAFCIMKFEAKCGLTDGANCTAQKAYRKPISQPDGTPWLSVSQLTAKSECASLGKGFHLISNMEWMTVASNVAENAANWCTATGTGCGTQGVSITTGDVSGGTLVLNRGHADGDPNNACDAQYDNVEGDCTTQGASTEYREKRTNSLLSGDLIWDLGGNVREWTSYFNKSDKPYDADDAGPVDAWREYTLIDSGLTTMPLSSLIPTNALKSFWDDTWSSSQNIGRYRAGISGSGGALPRGGNWLYGAGAGLFGGRLNNDPTIASASLGFRCAARP